MQLSFDFPRDASALPICGRVLGPMLQSLCLKTERAAAIELAVIGTVGLILPRIDGSPAPPTRLTLEFDADRLRVQMVDSGQGLLHHVVDGPEPAACESRGLAYMERVADSLAFWTTAEGGCHLQAEFCFPPVWLPLAPP